MSKYVKYFRYYVFTTLQRKKDMVSVNYKKIKKKYEKGTYFLLVDWEDNFILSGHVDVCFTLPLYTLPFFSSFSMFYNVKW